MGEIKLRLGSPLELRQILGDETRARSLTPRNRARALELWGWAAKQEGNLSRASDLFSKSIELASAGDEFLNKFVGLSCGY